MNSRQLVLTALESAYPSWMDIGRLVDQTGLPYGEAVEAAQQLIDESACAFDPAQGVRLAGFLAGLD